MEQITSSKKIAGLHDRASNLYNAMRREMDGNIDEKQLVKRFNVKQAAELVGRSDMTIRRAEDEGTLPPPARSENGYRVGYTLEDLNRMRATFGTSPQRAESDEAIVLAVQNFKGGVAKTTLSTHAAQYFALMGYRVCVVDADPQASLTGMFGIHPGTDVEGEETLLPFLAGDESNLIYAVRPTYWDGLDIIPACLELYNAEYIIAAGGRDADGARERFEKLRIGLSQISVAYDILIIDAPPALGMISLNIIRAANALLIPTPPSSIDFSSTVSFLQMLSDVLESMEAQGFSNNFKFVQLVASKVNENKTAHLGMRDAMREVFGADILRTALLDSAEYDNANVDMRTVYEYTGRSNATYKRCRSNLDQVMRDLEMAVVESWPSHRARLRERGVA